MAGEKPSGGWDMRFGIEVGKRLGISRHELWILRLRQDLLQATPSISRQKDEEGDLVCIKSDPWVSYTSI